MWGDCTQRVSVRNEQRANTTVHNLSKPAAFSSLLTAKRKYCVTGLPDCEQEKLINILLVFAPLEIHLLQIL
ncbi:unnamed protein product [Acanthoscelides obtectus]|uniref:Uncharacterized protein n=1 Tax=Acanthoscelides obtectus TaxID=200917 RepID=A0A9P0JZK6_ACAOB|nr:unnamed protein product [Acanthoscelides obtectus]CAK1631619.1 hypothetical protein AOBTE_LOCUS7052 [Acanthoscelides obtectus]